jgi:small subunit ribosomal protein S9
MATATTKEPVKKEHTTAHAAPAHAGVAKAARYIEAIGRRKTAIARVRVSVGDGKVMVNGKSPKEYFTLPRLVAAALSPLTELKLDGGFDVSAHVSGGGIHAQAEAIRLGIARAILEKDSAWKLRLRAAGFLTRDSRMVERKKPGLLKARRRPQWAKR